MSKKNHRVSLEKCQQLLQIVDSHPLGATAKELTAAIHRSYSATADQLRSLRRAGLVEFVGIPCPCEAVAGRWVTKRHVEATLADWKERCVKSKEQARLNWNAYQRKKARMRREYIPANVPDLPIKRSWVRAEDAPRPETRAVSSVWGLAA